LAFINKSIRIIGAASDRLRNSGKDSENIISSNAQRGKYYVAEERFLSLSASGGQVFYT